MIRFSASLLVCAIGLLPAAAEAACQSRGDLVCGGAPSMSSSGELQVSRGGGYAPLAGRGLRSGDRVLSGKSAATLSLGASCSASVSAGSVVAFSKSGDLTCARISQAGGAAGSAAAAGAGAGAGVGAAGAAVGIAAAVGVGVAFVGSDDNKKGGGTVSAR